MSVQTLRKYTTGSIITAVSTACVLIVLIAVNYFAYEISNRHKNLSDTARSLVSTMRDMQITIDELANHAETTEASDTELYKSLNESWQKFKAGLNVVGFGNAANKVVLPPHVQDFLFNEGTQNMSPYNSFLHVAEDVETILNLQKQKIGTTNIAKKKEINDILHSAHFDINNDIKTMVEPHLEKLFSLVEEERVISKKRWNYLYYGVAGLGFVVLLLQLFFIASPLKRRLETTITNQINEHEELLQTKQALVEADARYELALSGTKFGIWDWDLRTNSLYWSPQLQQMLGLTTGQFKGTLYDFENRVLPDDLEKTMQTARQHIESGTPFNCDFRMRHEDGYTVWISSKGQAIWDASGKPMRMAGSMEDVTEKKETELKSELFIAGLEASPMCICILDMTGNGSKRFTYVSPAFCTMTGYTQLKLLNANLNILIGPDTDMSDLDSIDAAIKNAETLTLEILNYKQDGTAFKNRIQMTPVFDELGKLKAYVMIHHDMTLDIAKERQEINRQRMESLGTLASNVAHEINNLLVPMMMARDIIEPDLKENSDPYTLEHVDQIVAYAEQAREIVKGILTFARKEVETRIVYDFASVMNETIEFVSGLVRNDTKFVFEPKTTEPFEVLINKTEFRQIITNFISNADYALRGVPEAFIKITTQQKALSHRERADLDIATNDCVELTIEDNGNGIPQNVINRIFEPLFTTKPIGEGTGLGLSVVHGIIKSWGGSITVESQENIGTKFTLYIPLYFDSDDIAMYGDLLDELNETTL